MKVLYFDYWLKGYKNFIQIDAHFKEKGINTKLFHIGSWRETTKILTNVEGLDCYDIKFYNTNLVSKVIEYETPDIIVLLNISFLIDRVIIDTCKRKNIKVIYLAHGKLSNIGILNEYISSSNKKIWYTIYNKFRKEIFFTIYNYFYNLILNKKFFFLMSQLFKLIKSPGKFQSFSTFCEELNIDKYLVYYQSDKEMMIKKLFFPEKKIFVIGNPELYKFKETVIINKDIFINQLQINTLKYILYLEDGLVYNKIWKLNDWLLFLSDLYSYCFQENITLIIKLHPKTEKQILNEFIKNKNIKIFTNICMKNLVFYSDFCISHYSSTIIYPLILNKPVLSPRWGISNKLTLNFPENVIRYCYSINDFFEKAKTSDLKTNFDDSYLNSTIGDISQYSIENLANNILN